MRIKKGRIKFIQTKIGKIIIWKHIALLQYFLYKFLRKCPIDLILTSRERIFEALKLCSLPQIHKK